MESTRLDQLPRPFVVAVIAEPTVRQASQAIECAARDGADAFELNLPPLGDISWADLARTIDEAAGPVYVTCRRRAFLAIYGFEPAALPAWSEEERMARSLAAIDLGAVAMDVELDTFDPTPAPALGTSEAALVAAEVGPPYERSDDPAAVARQVAIVEAAHDRGGQVLMSCHTGRPQDVAGLRHIADSARARGADLFKIVMPCRGATDLAILREADDLLTSVTSMPFVLVGAGPAGRDSRSPGQLPNSAWLFARPPGASHSFPEHPLVADLVAAVRALTPG